MEKLYDAVEKNCYGFYELKKEFRKEMNSFYEETYFQENKSLYRKEYSEEELEYKANLLKEKQYIFSKLSGTLLGKSFLDVGCGEGYALAFFAENGWKVCGIDYSDYGIKAHNPKMLKFLLKGDLNKIINLINQKFNFIIIDNVLEHIPDANSFLKSLPTICSQETVICITVPNDFSLTQKELYKNNCIKNAFWVTEQTSEHFNYFTLPSLSYFLEENGFEIVWKSADYPIDFNLFNPRTNYVKDKNVGHDGYVAKIRIENMLYDNSLENTVNLHRAYAENGIGRNISVYMKLKRE